MKTFSLKNRIPAVAAGVAAAFLLVAVAQDAAAQRKELPFRAKQDGTVHYGDLIELTRQAPSRDSITDDELAAIKEKSVVRYGELFSPTEQPEMPPRTDLYDSSIILSDGVNHTLLPLRSLLFVPERYQQRVVEKPVGKLILWPEFRRLHANWLRTFEVSLKNAKGEEPIGDALREQYESGFQIVVSQYRQSPISVMPLKEPQPEGESTEKEVEVTTVRASGATKARR